MNASIRRHRQPYLFLCGLLERLCALIGHYDGCALLNRHGHPFSAPYQWLAQRAVVWEALPEYRNS